MEAKAVYALFLIGVIYALYTLPGVPKTEIIDNENELVINVRNIIRTYKWIFW